MARVPGPAALTSRRLLSTAPTTLATTTTTAAPEPSTTQAPAKPQASGSVKELQQRLADLGYDVGTIDGLAGTQTYYAITAFQRVQGLSRTGEDSDELRAALATASRPGPLVPGGDANRVEVDLNRQVLFLWQGGALARILPVSTGSGDRSSSRHPLVASPTTSCCGMSSSMACRARAMAIRS